MALERERELTELITLSASCNACGWSGSTSFDRTEPHSETMIYSAREDLRIMHSEESPDCTASPTFSR